MSNCQNCSHCYSMHNWMEKCRHCGCDNVNYDYKKWMDKKDVLWNIKKQNNNIILELQKQNNELKQQNNELKQQNELLQKNHNELIATICSLLGEIKYNQCTQ